MCYLDLFDSNFPFIKSEKSSNFSSNMESRVIAQLDMLEGTLTISSLGSEDFRLKNLPPQIVEDTNREEMVMVMAKITEIFLVVKNIFGL